MKWVKHTLRCSDGIQSEMPEGWEQIVSEEGLAAILRELRVEGGVRAITAQKRRLELWRN